MGNVVSVASNPVSVSVSVVVGEGRGIRLREAGKEKYNPHTSGERRLNLHSEAKDAGVGGITPAFRLLHCSGSSNSNPCWCSGNGGDNEFE